MRSRIILLFILAWGFAVYGESVRVSVDAEAVKTTGNITATVKGSGTYLPGRYGDNASLELKNGASLALDGKTSLLAGKHGTVEMHFSPRNFRMSAAAGLHLELRPVEECFIRGVLSNDVWNFFVTRHGVTERHWIPVYSWHGDGRDITRVRQILTIAIGFKGVHIYLDGRCAETAAAAGGDIKSGDALFRLASAAPFEFISLHAADTFFSEDQVLDRYVSLQGGQKMIDRPFLRIPRSRKQMTRNGAPGKRDYDDAAALSGMNDVVTNGFIQGDLEYYLKYDDRHFYIFSAAPAANKRSLGFFAMLKYTETFDSGKFTLNPWQSLAVAGSPDSKWFTRSAIDKGSRLAEAWLESFADFGVAPPRPGVTWEVNFSCRSSAEDYGAWYQSDVKTIKSYGIIEFGGDDDLFARMLVPPVFEGNTLKVEAGCVNPSAGPRGFSFVCELFRPDGEIISLKNLTGKIDAASPASNAVLLDTGNHKTLLLKVILRDDHDRIFYRRTFILKRS